MSTTRWNRRGVMVAAAILGVLVLGAVAIGCGSDETDETSATSVDRAFAAEMVPHHEGAIEIAEVAKQQAEHREVRVLADDIVAGQTAEIRTLRRIEGELKDKGIEHGQLGLDEHSMGMDGHMSDLEHARPFDREFITMMIAHHEGAIRMAREELADGRNAELRQIAREVIEAQSREIAQMRRWSKRWYGRQEEGSAVHMDGSM